MLPHVIIDNASQLMGCMNCRRDRTIVLPHSTRRHAPNSQLRNLMVSMLEVVPVQHFAHASRLQLASQHYACPTLPVQQASQHTNTHSQPTTHGKQQLRQGTSATSAAIISSKAKSTPGLIADCCLQHCMLRPTRQQLQVLGH